jgi:hypothetical protein
VYTPPDLRPEVYANAPDEALVDFIAECDIELRAAHQRILV